MIKTYSNIISLGDITSLLNYQNIIDDRSDVRPDVITKHPRWDLDEWPQNIIDSVLRKTLKTGYTVDEVIFNIFKISYKLHVDSGKTEKQRKGYAILLPLYTKGKASTVFFDNYWNGPSTKFSRSYNSPFQYQLPNKKNKFILISDIRELYKQAINSPQTITEFEVNDPFIKTLEYLIDARSNKKLGPVDNRCYDYSQIVNYDEFKKFDEKIRKKHLNHIDLESLNGLTLDRIIDWKIGDAIVFNRNRIHSASSTHNEKSCVTIFTSQS